MRVRAFASFAAVSIIALFARDVSGDPVTPAGAAKKLDAPNGVRLLRAMGPHAERALAPATGRIGALVALPKGASAASLGLDEVAPGIGRMRGTAAQIDAFSVAHPGLRVEVAPPLHALMKQAGVWTQAAVAANAGMDGTGALVGVADTGVDVTHPDMQDASGHTRVQWLLDYSLPPYGKYPELEKLYGVKDDAGNVLAGAVLDAEEINLLLTRGDRVVIPSDQIGHGTHVSSIAASSGNAKGNYQGIAPKAGILFVRITHANSEAIQNDDLVSAVQFLFDRADFMKKPIAVNLSLGSDFGSHDGKMLWEQTIASYVGADKPGHVLVAAAGNSGSVADLPIHQVVHVAPGATTKVPVVTGGAESGTVQVWVSLRKNASIQVGLDGPDGEWISPVSDGNEAGKNTSDYNAGVIFGQSDPQSPIPPDSRGAVVVWTGKWPTGTYNVKLEGDGMVDLYLQGIGDASSFSTTPAHFAEGVREGTINLPATNEAIISVGCTVNHVRWQSVAGADVGISVPVLDARGGLPDASGKSRDLQQGEICWFSSAGPNALGVAKPEIAAPGGVVIAGMSSEAPPSSPNSIFYSANDCPPLKSGKTDNRCLQVDQYHAVSVGTSMSSPMVAGAAAILLQRDPTLTQPQVTAALQAGAHRFRGLAQFDDQSGPGELDVVGALNALEHMKSPQESLPSPGAGWITLSESFVPADGSTEMTVICELRTASGDQADFVDPTRLSPVVIFDGQRQSGADVVKPLTRRGPGVWVYQVDAPPGFGGSFATFGLEMDGQPIVKPKSVPIATDPWNASYPSHAVGACNVQSIGARTQGMSIAAIGTGIFIAARARRRRRQRKST